ncbi:MAG: hypothetical protein HN742_12380 [Lentisphaerae bacterium]|nr:hypothetical protein [Lentisphaerota bacterium]MBT4817682.1 hypothetical protein [Lentisphaerota bacterium]MBT5607209.1 hypothetical protein [Lentisphaerota bacterium]MBT7054455.1 hypothetical protein [Lentisphaerota bacterium]MBT7842665.1 hypothetical protein [Lentisphaerota bacterium]
MLIKSICGVLAILATVPAHGELTLYVSHRGSDDAPGTADKPFATLTRARDKIRGLKQRGPLPSAGVTVQIAPGTYRLDETFALDRRDSGTANCPIVYRSAPEKRAWLDGGHAVSLTDLVPLTNAEILARLPEVARPHVRCIDLNELGIGYIKELPDYFNCYSKRLNALAQLQLFYADKPLYEARWPNHGFTHFGDVLELGEHPRVEGGRGGAFTFTPDPARLKRWANAEELILHGYFRRDYYSFSARVAAIDLERSAITLAKGLVDEAHHSRRFYAHHLPEELDLPGEWILHRKNGLLCLWPPDNKADDQVMLTGLNGPMISIDGAAFVSLHGLGIQGGRQDAIAVRDGESNRITACEIRACGWSAVVVEEGHNVRVAGCDIHNLGFGGIILSGGDRETLTPSGHVAENNHIHHLSHVVRNYTEPLLLKGAGNRASHNLIHHIPHIAVRFYGNDHIMEYNEIYQVAYETSECGVFYTGYDWTARGNVIRYNFLHHIDGVGGSPRFAHLDDSASGTELHGNVSYMMSAGPAVCGGNENLIHDNLFIECESAGSIGPRGQDDMSRDANGEVVADRSTMGYGLLKRLRRMPWQTPPWSTRYPKLAELFTRDPIAAPWFNAMTRNVIVGGERGIDVSSAMKKGWSTVAQNWRVEDPGFVEPDHTKMDFRLKPDAPVYQKGFQPLPFEKIGLRASPERASWPVKPAPTPAEWSPNWVLRRQTESRFPVTVFPVNSLREGRAIHIDGNVTPEEWSPPDYDPVDPDRHREITIRWGLDQNEVPYPSKAYIEMDSANLYVAFINPVDPKHGVTDGQRWGRNDAVEIALAPVPDVAHQGGEVPLVFRGYANGHAECSTEPGWLQAEVDRVMAKGVTYVARVNGPGEWSAEWRIPFAAIGIDPATKPCPILAHLSVRKTGGNMWVQWRKRTASTWKIHGTFALWLIPAGELPFVPGMLPAEARIDVRSADKTVRLTPGKKTILATWSKPLGYRLTTGLGHVSAARWQPCEFDFTPQADGDITLELMGTQGKPTTWTYHDAFEIKGAESTNGDFEGGQNKGVPTGWKRRLGEPELVENATLAASGSHMVRVSHDHRFCQTISVQRGRKVTVRFRARAALP